MKLLIAVPAYSGTVSVETVRSLLQEQTVAQAAGIDFRALFLPGCSLITMARNQMAQDFVDSDADKMVFIDSDISWEPGSIVQLASHNVDFVGGAYRLKSEDECYPVEWLENGRELWAKDGLLKTAHIPGGFMCLSRAVFARFRVSYPVRRYTHHGHDFHAYFHAPFHNGRLYGEDAAFCHDWREIGGDVWVDPELTLTHHDGRQAYRGCLGDFLRSRIPHQEAA